MAKTGDEEDYMSDAFLQSDTKPGLMPKVFLNKHKRKENATKRISFHNNKAKSMKLQEVEKRTEKLQTALDESNKGFAMLAKMGFKKGMGLGKVGQGISEPIPLEIKSGRKGLGKESDEEQRKHKRLQAYSSMIKKRRVEEESLKGDFKSRMKDKINERQTLTDFYKSQKACEQLDSSKNKEQPDNPWFWPIAFKEEEEDHEDEKERDEEEEEEGEENESVFYKLEMLTDYLRNEYYYCIWCGTAYNDTADLSSNCPGNTFALHDD